MLDAVDESLEVPVVEAAQVSPVFRLQVSIDGGQGDCDRGWSKARCRRVLVVVCNGLVFSVSAPGIVSTDTKASLTVNCIVMVWRFDDNNNDDDDDNDDDDGDDSGCGFRNNSLHILLMPF